MLQKQKYLLRKYVKCDTTQAVNHVITVNLDDGWNLWLYIFVLFFNLAQLVRKFIWLNTHTRVRATSKRPQACAFERHVLATFNMVRGDIIRQNEQRLEFFLAERHKWLQSNML